MDRISLTENQLYNLINESIIEALNEISFDKVKKAYDGMKNIGQNERALKLNKTHSHVYDSDDAKFDLLGDGRLSLRGDNGDSTSYVNNSRDNDVGTNKDKRRYRYNHNGKYDTVHDTSNPKKAKSHANALNHFTGTNDYSKNNFIK
jgi:hypothetical protein